MDVDKNVEQTFDVAVIGGGLAGLSAALASGLAGYRTALVAPDNGAMDGRTTALMMPSVELLDSLGVWRDAKENSAALRTMRILDATNRLVRAPAVSFHASELGLDAFGYNIPNQRLLDALSQAAEECDQVSRYHSSASIILERSEYVAVELEDGTALEAKLVAGADGRHSLVRQTIGVDTREWRYPQKALVLNFSHQLSHDDISNEFHTEDGPFTQVPLPGLRSSLVWAMKPHLADEKLQLQADALATEIENKMQSMLGKVRIDGDVQMFPFSGMIAHRFARGRCVLIGEAGHVFPPIGAQGLNLGLRDVTDLVRLLRQSSGEFHASKLAERYNRARRADVSSRTVGVDMLNRSLLSGFLPVQMVRSGGLFALSRIAPLRQFVMREGLKPGSGLRSALRF